MISTPTLAAGRGVQPWVFWPAAGVILAFSGFAILAPAAAEALFAGIQVTIDGGSSLMAGDFNMLTTFKG